MRLIRYGGNSENGISFFGFVLFFFEGEFGFGCVLVISVCVEIRVCSIVRVGWFCEEDIEGLRVSLEEGYLRKGWRMYRLLIKG